MMLDGLPVPELDCPKCGAKKWRYLEVEGQTDLQRQLLKISDRLMTASFCVFVMAVFLFILPGLQDLGFVAVGLLLVLGPSGFLVRRWIYRIKTMVNLCEACGFTSAQ